MSPFAVVLALSLALGWQGEIVLPHVKSRALALAIGALVLAVGVATARFLGGVSVEAIISLMITAGVGAAAFLVGWTARSVLGGPW